MRVDAIWLSVQPMDMRMGTDTALARVVAVFGAARPHHAYVFSNRRGDRLKVLVHDGIGIWLAARRLQQGGFARHGLAQNQALSRAQFDALVLGFSARLVQFLEAVEAVSAETQHLACF